MKTRIFTIVIVTLGFLLSASCRRSNEEKQISIDGWLFINTAQGFKDEDGKDIVLISDEGEAFLTEGECGGRVGLYPCGPVKEGAFLISSADLYMVSSDKRKVLHLLLRTDTSLELPSYPRSSARGLIRLGEENLYYATGTINPSDQSLGGVPMFVMDVDSFGEVPKADQGPPKP